VSQNLGLDSERPSGIALLDLSFQRFITLNVVKWLYLLLLVLAGLFWLIGVITGFTMGFGVGLLGIVVVSLAVAIHVILWRVALELMVVIFRIGEHTKALAAQKAGAAVETPAA
jgi:hypothetical protein